MEAAVRVFAENGYEQATLDEIAQRAEFGKGTIYHYFKNKEDLFIELLRYGLGQFETIVMESAQFPDPSSYVRFRQLITVSTKFIKENELFYRVVLNEHHRIHKIGSNDLMKLFIDGHNNILKILSKILEDGIKRKEIKPIHTLKAADLFMHMLHGIAFSNICNCKDIFIKEDSDLIMTIFFDGVLVENKEEHTGKVKRGTNKSKRGK